MKRRSNKRYWANVSEVFFQSQGAARSVLRRAKMTFEAILARRPRIENFSNSSSENNICAGAFRCAFTIYFERNVAFHIEIIGFMLSETKVT